MLVIVSLVMRRSKSTVNHAVRRREFVLLDQKSALFRKCLTCHYRPETNTQTISIKASYSVH